MRYTCRHLAQHGELAGLNQFILGAAQQMLGVLEFGVTGFNFAVGPRQVVGSLRDFPFQIFSSFLKGLFGKATLFHTPVALVNRPH